MVIAHLARWEIDYDAEATRCCYAALPVGSGCDCAYCRNYLAALDQALPPEFRSFADRLGIDLTKPAELAHYDRDESGLWLTQGWYHFVGSILAGDDVVHRDGASGTYRFETLVPGLEFGFGRQLDLLPEPFKAGPAVQLDFFTRIPWTLDEPPDGGEGIP